MKKSVVYAMLLGGLVALLGGTKETASSLSEWVEATWDTANRFARWLVRGLALSFLVLIGVSLFDVPVLTVGVAIFLTICPLFLIAANGGALVGLDLVANKGRVVGAIALVSFAQLIVGLLLAFAHIRNDPELGITLIAILLALLLSSAATMITDSKLLGAARKLLVVGGVVITIVLLFGGRRGVAEKTASSPEGRTTVAQSAIATQRNNLTIREFTTDLVAGEEKHLNFEHDPNNPQDGKPACFHWHYAIDYTPAPNDAMQIRKSADPEKGFSADVEYRTYYEDEYLTWGNRRVEFDCRLPPNVPVGRLWIWIITGQGYCPKCRQTGKENYVNTH